MSERVVSAYEVEGGGKYVEVVDYVSSCGFSVCQALDEGFCCGGVLR